MSNLSLMQKMDKVAEMLGYRKETEGWREPLWFPPGYPESNTPIGHPCEPFDIIGISKIMPSCSYFSIVFKKGREDALWEVCWENEEENLVVIGFGNSELEARVDCLFNVLAKKRKI